jgi:hypothetical protein
MRGHAWLLSLRCCAACLIAAAPHTCAALDAETLVLMDSITETGVLTFPLADVYYCLGLRDYLAVLRCLPSGRNFVYVFAAPSQVHVGLVLIYDSAQLVLPVFVTAVFTSFPVAIAPSTTHAAKASQILGPLTQARVRLQLSQLDALPLDLRALYTRVRGVCVCIYVYLY